MVQCLQVHQAFSIADEFVLHVFKAHIVANICEKVKIETPLQCIQREATPEWLEEIAETMLSSHHRTQMTQFLLYTDCSCMQALGFSYYINTCELLFLMKNGGNIVHYWKYTGFLFFSLATNTITILWQRSCKPSYQSEGMQTSQSISPIL